MKKFLVFVTGAFMLLSLEACRKKEEKLPQVSPPSAGVPMSSQFKEGQDAQLPQKQISGHGAGTRSEIKIVVPDTVKGKWSRVRIILRDKAANKTEELLLALNSEAKIPDSGLRIAVSDFIPDFRMDAGIITSATGEPNNPAVRIKVYEGEKEIFKGWLFSKFPDIHPFEHPKYGITLKEGVRKGQHGRALSSAG